MVQAKSEYILSDDGGGAPEKDPLKDVPVSSGYDVKPTMSGADGADPPFATPPTSAEYPAPPPPPPPPTHHLSNYSPYHPHPHSHHYGAGHQQQQPHGSGGSDLGGGAPFPYSSSPSSSLSASSSSVRPPMGNSNSSSASSITGSSSTGSAGSIGGGGGMPPLQTQQKAGKAKNRPNAGQFVNKEFSLSGPVYSLLMRSSIIASVASINPFTPFMFTRG